MRRNIGIFAATLTTLILASCAQEELSYPDSNSTQNQIVATIDNPVEKRTAVGTSSVGQGATILWTAGDRLGVFAATGTQQCYQKVGTASSATASFAATGGTALESPQYAYYPYSTDNNDRAATELLGNLPATQDMTSGTLHGDYKVGRVGTSSASGHAFLFTHLFSVGRIVVDASGTPLNGETLEKIEIKVAASDGTLVPLAGPFTFDATAETPSYTRTGNSSEAIILDWTGGTQPALSSPVACYACFFPEVQTGSTFTITGYTASYRAEFTATALTSLASGTIYDFPVAFNKYTTLKVYDRATGTLLQDGPYSDGDHGTTTPETPETLTGTFTCATLNVDGLSLMNSDGPGSSGTTKIGEIINGLGWDFVGVSEDFAYNSQLVAALTNYDSGTYRGNATSLYSNDTDGLNFFWNTTNGISAANESWTAYNDEIGGLTDGANTLINKGFRHYEVTVADGITVDVYITHMNTWSDKNPSGYSAVQIAQLCQLRDYVVEKAQTNNRPAIIMGDTNMRYTRHAIETNLMKNVQAHGLEIYDPWVMFHRGGTYPTYETKSLMIQSMYKGDTTNDICCSDDQRGEVVDKVWYINVSGAPLQLTATSCQNDVANFTKSTATASYSGIAYEDANGTIHENYSVSYTRSTGIADHFPVVVGFTYTYTPTNTAN